MITVWAWSIALGAGPVRSRRPFFVSARGRIELTIVTKNRSIRGPRRRPRRRWWRRWGGRRYINGYVWQSAIQCRRIYMKQNFNEMLMELLMSDMSLALISQAYNLGVPPKSNVIDRQMHITNRIAKVTKMCEAFWSRSEKFAQGRAYPVKRKMHGARVRR